MITLKRNEYISYDSVKHNPSWSGLKKAYCKTIDVALHENTINGLKVYITGTKNENIAFSSTIIPVLLEGDECEKVHYLLFSDEPLTQIKKRYLIDNIGNKYRMKPVARCPYIYYSYPIIDLEKCN